MANTTSGQNSAEQVDDGSAAGQASGENQPSADNEIEDDSLKGMDPDAPPA